MIKRDQYLRIAAKNPRQIELRRISIHLLLDVSFWAAMIGAHQLAPAWLSAIANPLLFCAFTFRAFGMMHDCVHDAAFEKRRFNSVFGWIWGTFCFLPYGSWRRLHLDHHNWTGNVEKDPSMKLLIEYRDRGYNFRRQLPVFWRTWIPGLALEQHFVFWRATIGKRESLFVLAAVLYLAAAAALIGLLGVALGLVLYLIMVEVINFPHHLDLVQYTGESKFKPFEQTAFTRSCHYPKWFAHLFLCNFNLHNEHHLFPAHPWYQLDNIHQDLRSENVKVNESSRNAWIVKNRKRSLGDVFGKTFEPHGEESKSDKVEIRVA